MLVGPSAGLAALTALERPLADYHLFYAARADMLERTGGAPRPDLERARNPRSPAASPNRTASPSTRAETCGSRTPPTTTFRSSTRTGRSRRRSARPAPGSSRVPTESPSTRRGGSSCPTAEHRIVVFTP